MHFLIIGGSGRTGKLVVEEGLSKGHQITALVRSTNSLAPEKNLVVIQGTPLKVEDIESTFVANPVSTPSAVIVALAARRATNSPFAPPSADTPPRMMADSVANIITVMKKHGVRRIIIMSSIGTGNSYSSLNFGMRAIFTHSNMRHQMVDHNAVDMETREAGVEYVIVRPVMLAEGGPAKVKVYPDSGEGSGFMPKITRASVARFMVDLLEGDEYVGRSPVITN